MPWAHGRGFDRLPGEVTAGVAGSLVRSLDGKELRRALRVVVNALLREVREVDRALSARLSGPLNDAADV